MTIHERMEPRSEREKDLLKYGRSHERERIIKLLEERKVLLEDPNNHYITAMNIAVTKESAMAITDATIWLIKGETNG
jgi:hypothetical protein